MDRDEAAGRTLRLVRTALKGRRVTASSGASKYSSKIIKAGALLADTKLLLEGWDENTDVGANLSRFRQKNVFGKASRSRVGDILAIFRQRYLNEPDLLGALVALAKGRMSSASLDRILYLQATRSDLLLRDVVAEVLLPKTGRPDPLVRSLDVEAWLAAKVSEGKTERPWSPAVQRRVAQGLLATLRDFGVLEGVVRKRIGSVYLPTDAFAFVAFQLAQDEPSGERLLDHPEWRLFLLQDGIVERFFLEAHQERRLQYHAAGRVVRIDFPAATLTEYARVLVERARLAA